jgi:hypothetical protein
MINAIDVEKTKIDYKTNPSSYVFGFRGGHLAYMWIFKGKPQGNILEEILEYLWYSQSSQIFEFWKDLKTNPMLTANMLHKMI